MTEEALNGAVEAAPEVVAVPENPISVDNVDHEAEAREAEAAAKAKEPKPKDEAKPLTTRETIEKAAAKIEADEKAKATEPKDKDKDAEAATKAERDEKGKFAPKVAAEAAEKTSAEVKEPAKAEVAPVAKAPHDEPPARFSADAKATWATVPEPARAETHRALRELESGIEEHRKQWEPVKPYADMAKQYGTTIDAALERYVAFDKDLNEDLIGGLDRIIRDKTGGQQGLKDIIGQLTGQKPEQAQSEAATTIHRLEQKISQLEKSIGGVTGHIQSQTAQTINQQVATFAADKPNFEALADKVAEHIQTGKSLEEAYDQAVTDAQEMAKRLGFIPQAAEPDPAPAPSAQTDKGTKSITGAPSAGSAPAAKKPSSSISDAVRRAMQAAG